jgi:hypothetical protein
MFNEPNIAPTIYNFMLTVVYLWCKSGKWVTVVWCFVHTWRCLWKSYINTILCYASVHISKTIGNMKNIVLWIVMLCSLQRSQRLEGIYHLYLHGVTVSQGRNQLILLPVSSSFLLGLLFNRGHGGDVFLWNVRLSLHCMTLNPEDGALHNLWCENFKSNSIDNMLLFRP